MVTMSDSDGDLSNANKIDNSADRVLRTLVGISHHSTILTSTKD
jgi:hypothetical protein